MELWLKDFSFLVLWIKRYPDYKMRISFCIILILIPFLFNFDPIIAFHGGPHLNPWFGNDEDDDIEESMCLKVWQRWWWWQSWCSWSIKANHYQFSFGRKTLIKIVMTTMKKISRDGLLVCQNQNTRTCRHLTLLFNVGLNVNGGIQKLNLPFSNDDLSFCKIIPGYLSSCLL